MLLSSENIADVIDFCQILCQIRVRVSSSVTDLVTKKILYIYHCVYFLNTKIITYMDSL